MRSSQTVVELFLRKLKATLLSDNFNIDTDFIFILNSKDDLLFSTKYTMAELGYDTRDVVDRLLELTVQDYSETLLDRDDMDPPRLFVFGKDIKGKQVYIKIKQRESVENKVICVSFHYAKYSMPFPYR